LGNLGFETVRCDFAPFIMEKVFLSCPYGNITGIVENGLGINKHKLAIKNGCLKNDTLF
jgi:hypothetical protein